MKPGYDELMQALCELLEDELEHQQNALDIRRSLIQYAKDRNLKQIQAMTRSLSLLIQESSVREKARTALVARLAHAPISATNLPTLQQLAQAAPIPWQVRLHELRERMEQVINDNMLASRQCEVLLSNAMNIVSRALNTYVECFERHGDAGYTPGGREYLPNAAAPLLMDSKG